MERGLTLFYDLDLLLSGNRCEPITHSHSELIIRNIDVGETCEGNPSCQIYLGLLDFETESE